jgi:SAM-dependent methyltransferase
MAADLLGAPEQTLDWASPATYEPAPVPVDEDVVDIAAGKTPGKALELGCGVGQNAVWLARRGWVVTAVDVSPGNVAEAREAAERAGVSLVLQVAELAGYRPASRFDLVVSTYSLPARGFGRGRMLDMAAAAVAPGGTILLTELDISMAKGGWMPEKYLCSREELERHLEGFRIDRSRMRMARRRHGYEEIVLPVANVVATRLTDPYGSWG